jgi:hypothetical protein
MALRVGAVKLTKMRGAFDLATIGSSAGGNTGSQTLEYKGFDGKKASKMHRATMLRRAAGTFLRATGKVIRFSPGSVHPTGGLSSRWGRHRNHQTEALQQQYGALGGASPDKLATFTLTILDVDVAARILQAAILELAIHIDAIV